MFGMGGVVIQVQCLPMQVNELQCKYWLNQDLIAALQEIS